MPATATPTARPIWRLALLMAAATPACSRGMPEIAVWLIGALTLPKPIPTML
jgi:hypothetical protein